MIRVKLKEALQAHYQRTQERMTYEELAKRSGLSTATIASLASRAGYNPTLSVIDRLCFALECPVQDLLEHQQEPKPTK
jgi:DNA-binding Xre family transcriptional regulator